MKWYLATLPFVSTVARAEGIMGGAQGITPFIPLIIIFGIFYFLIIRPQQKRAKQQQQFLTELKRGDMVITNAGIVGMVKALSEKIITLEVDEGVCLKILRSQILEAANNLNKDAKQQPA
jgi:preprotein translocase subunit YajC